MRFIDGYDRCALCACRGDRRDLELAKANG